MTYSIASGHDNAAGLTALTSLIPSGGTAIRNPFSYGSYRPGVRRVRPDGVAYNTGFAEAVWTFRVLFGDQYNLLNDDYANDETNGNKVTVRTPGPDGAFANYNARILLPERADLVITPDSRRPFMDVEVRLIRLEAI